MLIALLSTMSFGSFVFVDPSVFHRQLDTSPSGRGFGDGDFGSTSPTGAGGSSGPLSARGTMPKLNDLDIALGLGGPTSAVAKKVLSLRTFFVSLSQMLVVHPVFNTCLFKNRLLSTPSLLWTRRSLSLRSKPALYFRWTQTIPQATTH